MRFYVPIRLPSLSNVRVCWQRLTSLKKKQRQAVALAMQVELGPYGTPPRPPLIVTLTRVGPRRLDDDNLEAACKYVRDQIARMIGTDDGSPLYTWVYEQERGNRGQYGVYIEIVDRGDKL
jgi:hypothetical protein